MSTLKSLNDFNYFDSPDGKDIFQKVWCAGKAVGILGLGLSTMDVMLHSQHKGYLQILGRYAYICFPLIGISTAFVVVTNTATNLRQKDDKINWALGAVAAGCVFGAWRRSNLAGFTASSLFTGAALLKKHALQNDWTLIDHKWTQQQGDLRSVRTDFSLIKHRPGNWTNVAPEPDGKKSKH